MPRHRCRRVVSFEVGVGFYLRDTARNRRKVSALAIARLDNAISRLPATTAAAASEDHRRQVSVDCAIAGWRFVTGELIRFVSEQRLRDGAVVCGVFILY